VPGLSLGLLSTFCAGFTASPSNLKSLSGFPHRGARAKIPGMRFARASAVESPRATEFRDRRVAVAVGRVVVDHADGLHERIADRWPDEAPQKRGKTAGGLAQGEDARR